MADSGVSSPHYRTLRAIAIGLGTLFVAWSLLDYFSDRDPRAEAYAAAERHFEDQRYSESLKAFNALAQQHPEDAYARRGKARSLLQLNRLDEALVAYDRAIELSPNFAPAYANRGVLHDRSGRYALAIADYERAAELDDRTDEGPSWLTRFLRNQTSKQSTIRQRAAYLRAELAKPEEERQLRIPELDQQQRGYQQ